MRRRFRFEQNEVEYGVFGQFEPDQTFSVVELLSRSARMSRSAASPPGSSAMKVLAVVRGVDSAEQLRLELEKKFPGLTGFRPF